MVLAHTKKHLEHLELPRASREPLWMHASQLGSEDGPWGLEVLATSHSILYDLYGEGPQPTTLS